MSIDLLRLIRDECNRRGLTARPREDEGKKCKPRADVGDHPAQTDALTAKCLNGSKCGKEGKGGEQYRRNIRDSDQPRENAAAHGDHEDPHRPCDASTAVGQKYAECHEKRKRHRNRQRGTHIVTRIDRRTLSKQSRDERHGHSEKYDSDDEYDEKHPEQDEERTAAVRLVDCALRQTLNPQDQHAKPAEEDERIGERDVEANIRAREGVHGEIAENAAARQECPIEDECIGEDGGEMHEIERSAPLPCDRNQMEHDAGEQPRHERGVLDRIPAPVTAPAEYLVCPVAADEDARTEECPRDERPAPHWSEEARIQRCLYHALKRVGKGHGEQRVAHEDDRRVHRHPRILQQRVHPMPVHGNSLCGSKGALKEDEEDEHRSECVVDRAPRRCHPSLTGNQNTDNGVNHEPEEKRALLSRPECGELVEQRQTDGRVTDNIGVAEIIVQNNDEEERRCTERCKPR